jgi:hypothetical protein
LGRFSVRVVQKHHTNVFVKAYVPLPTTGVTDLFFWQPLGHSRLNLTAFTFSEVWPSPAHPFSGPPTGEPEQTMHRALADHLLWALGTHASLTGRHTASRSFLDEVEGVVQCTVESKHAGREANAPRRDLRLRRSGCPVFVFLLASGRLRHKNRKTDRKKQHFMFYTPLPPASRLSALQVQMVSDLAAVTAGNWNWGRPTELSILPVAQGASKKNPKKNKEPKKQSKKTTDRLSFFFPPLFL